MGLVDWLSDRNALAASHERSGAVARAWHESAPYRMIVDRFAAIDGGDPDGAAAAAEALFGQADLVGALLAPLVTCLAGDPLFEPPFRVRRDPLRIGAVIADLPAVSITASVMSADAMAALPPPRSVIVPGRLSVVRYERAGGARLRQWRVSAGGDNVMPSGVRALADGCVVRLDGRSHAHRIEGARGDVVMLSAMIRAGAAPFAREYGIDTGALIRSATLDDGASRTQMLLTLLRLSGSADAGGSFEAATRDGAFFLRWAAMREWLALDAAAALPRLREMADDPHEEVRAAAIATLPMVEAREAALCPA